MTNDEKQAMFVEAAKSIKVFFCDSDGVMFPNTVLMGADNKGKTRSYYDGQAISLLRAIGIRVVFITNEKEEAAAAIRETVEKFNGLPSSKGSPKANGNDWEPVKLYEGRGGTKKLETANEWLAENGFTLAESAYMGDDLVDVPLLRAVALPVAPAQGEKVVRDMALFVSTREGGSGAIRDFANMVLEVRGVDPTTLPPQ